MVHGVEHLSVQLNEEKAILALDQADKDALRAKRKAALKKKLTGTASESEDSSDSDSSDLDDDDEDDEEYMQYRLKQLKNWQDSLYVCPSISPLLY
jgi:hypothetical protein